jgi:hypothetical protein
MIFRILLVVASYFFITLAFIKFCLLFSPNQTSTSVLIKRSRPSKVTSTIVYQTKKSFANID